MTLSKVLVVDDEEAIRELISDVLDNKGFEIVEAATGDMAFALLGHFSPDLLLTDINMPGELDGVELAELARASRPALPVIFITGGLESAFRATRIAGPKLILQKPFKLARLAPLIQQMIGSAQPDLAFGLGTKSVPVGYRKLG